MGEKSEQINNLTQKIIGCAFTVHNTLGCGFLEKVYENALTHELRKSGLNAKQQHPLPVKYDDELVGDFYADLLVNDAILVELKVVKGLESVHMAQCMNYLKACNLEICLLLNFFRPRLEIKRIINSSSEKIQSTRNREI